MCAQPRSAFFLNALFIVFIAFLAAEPARAQQCSVPINLAANPSFDAGLTGYSNAAGWQYNQSLSTAIYGTTYTSRAAVQNPGAAPSGGAASAYPTASLNAFAINEEDGANDTLSITNPTGNYITYFSGELHIWFDMGWRQAGGNPTSAATLQIRVNSTTYMTVATVAGNAAGNATSSLSNGATVGSGTPSTFANTGGASSLSQWNTIHLVVPYSSGTLPTVSFVMSGGGNSSDDFAIDRVYVPLCSVSPTSVTKSSTIIADPVNGTSNPKAIPGATVRYCISIANPSVNPTLTSVDIVDVIRDNPVVFVLNSIKTNGSTVSGQCQWDGTSAGSYSNGVVSTTVSSIPAGATKTVYFDVTLN